MRAILAVVTAEFSMVNVLEIIANVGLYAKLLYIRLK